MWFWSGVMEGFLAPPFWWVERRRGAARTLRSGVRNGVHSKNVGAYTTLLVASFYACLFMQSSLGPARQTRGPNQNYFNGFSVGANGRSLVHGSVWIAQNTTDRHRYHRSHRSKSQITQITRKWHRSLQIHQIWLKIHKIWPRVARKSLWCPSGIPGNMF